jgi:hypothetical protein
MYLAVSVSISGVVERLGKRHDHLVDSPILGCLTILPLLKMYLLSASSKFSRSTYETRGLENDTI